MALTRRDVRSSSSIDPHSQLGQVARLVADLLPHQGLPLIDAARRWSDRLLVLVALLSCWAGGQSLAERFSLARSCAVEVHPTRRRPGAGYNGFVDCLARHHARLLSTLTLALRRRVVEVAGDAYRTFGFIVFGVDGTKIELPRTDSNLNGFGPGNKANAPPEALLCGLFHVATRSLWAFARDVGRGSERSLLASMLPCLPRGSLVLADAGFTGFATMRSLIEAGHHFVIRAGAGVELLRGLCHVRMRVRTRGDIVHLWPDREQTKNVKPIVLRQVIVRDGRGREMSLLTDVLDAARLSDAQVAQLYAMRWRVEVSYRWLKRTLHGRKVLSTSAGHAGRELDWTLMSLWMLTLMGLKSGVPGERLSIAGVLRVTREAITHRRRRGRGREPLRTRLQRAGRVDRYHRRSAKRKRAWPAQAPKHRCSVPLARMANPAEIERYQSLARDAA